MPPHSGWGAEVRQRVVLELPGRIRAAVRPFGLSDLVLHALSHRVDLSIDRRQPGVDGGVAGIKLVAQLELALHLDRLVLTDLADLEPLVEKPEHHVGFGERTFGGIGAELVHLLHALGKEAERRAGIGAIAILMGLHAQVEKPTLDLMPLGAETLTENAHGLLPLRIPRLNGLDLREECGSLIGPGRDVAEVEPVAGRVEDAIRASSSPDELASSLDRFGAARGRVVDRGLGRPFGGPVGGAVDSSLGGPRGAIDEATELRLRACRPEGQQQNTAEKQRERTHGIRGRGFWGSGHPRTESRLATGHALAPDRPIP